MAKNIEKFAKQQLSDEEATYVKGGIRDASESGIGGEGNDCPDPTPQEVFNCARRPGEQVLVCVNGKWECRRSP